MSDQTQSTELTIYTATYDGDPNYSPPTESEYRKPIKVRILTHNRNPELSVVIINELQFTVGTLKYINNCVDDHLEMVTE